VEGGEVVPSAADCSVSDQSNTLHRIVVNIVAVERRGGGGLSPCELNFGLLIVIILPSDQSRAALATSPALH